MRGFLIFLTFLKPQTPKGSLQGKAKNIQFVVFSATVTLVSFVLYARVPRIGLGAGGELGTRGSDKIRGKEAKEAAKLMGVAVRENLNLPDGKIEVTMENKIRLIKVIRKYRPEIIFSPYWIERHPDHENTSRLIREAWYLSGLVKLKTKLNGKVQRPHRPKKIFFYVQYFYQQFIPNLIIDITDVFEKKLKVIECYKSQFFNPNVNFDAKETLLSTPDFREYLIARARFFGEMIGRKYGEPFLTLSPIGLNGIEDVVLPLRS